VIPIHSSKISKNESNKSSLPGLGLEWTDMYRIQNIKKRTLLPNSLWWKYISENVVSEDSWSVVE